MNDAFDGSSGEPARVRRAEVRFGLAVDVPKADGSRTLLVPNVKGAERMNFAEFAAAADDVVTRARTGKIKVSDFEGTTISLTNPGTLGTTASVPRLMPGQGAIIATGAIEYPAQFRAMAPATLSLLAVSKVVTFTSTYDHRIIQGAESGAFLARVEELLLGEHGFYEGVFADLGIPFRPLRWEVDKNPPVFSDGHTDDVAKQARVLELINAYRVRGHLLADIDPLRTREIAHHPELDLETYGLTIWDLDREFWTGGLKGGDRLPLREIIAVMRRVYCGKIGTEYRYISSPTEKYWIRERIAAAANAGPLPKDVRRSLLAKLIAAEEFERFLGTKFLGQRRYSVEGVDTAIPLLDRLVEGAARRGVDEVVIGMSHRGRLNILANVVGNSAERIFSGFEGVVHPDFPADEGDVKYHQGARTTRRSESGRDVAIQVESNPSHLEAVDPVVEGVVRAKQERMAGHGPEAWKRALPVLLHGDAAFAGQGMVAEVLNLANLPGYRTGGTIHVVVNNQIGFTTPPSKGRSSVYSTDVAKINQVPIFHVNADDPEAAYRVLEIALDYRQEFHKDVVIDLIGFRRHGHNEGDEPTYTQPLMYRAIEAHPGVRTLYARRLVREGALTEDEVRALEARQLAEYEAALAAAKTAAQRPRAGGPAGAAGRRRRLRDGDGRLPRGARADRPRAHDGAAGLPPEPEDGPAARAPGEDVRGRAPARLGHGRGAGLRLAAARGHAHPHQRPGLEPRHVLAAARAAARHGDGGDLGAARDAGPEAGAVRGLRQPAVGIRGARLRLRLQRRVARGARDVGGAVRRLRQRRAGHRGPVHRLGRGQVAPDDAHGHAPAARLRGPGARALERAPGALPAALRRRQHADRERHDARAVLPPAAPPDAPAAWRGPSSCSRRRACCACRRPPRRSRR